MPNPIDYQSPSQQKKLVNKTPWILIVVVMILVGFVMGVYVFALRVGQRNSSAPTATTFVLASPPMPSPMRLPQGPTNYDVKYLQLTANSQLTPAQRVAKLADMITAAYQDGTLPARDGEPSKGEMLFITLTGDPENRASLDQEKYNLVCRLIREGYPQSTFVDLALPKEK